MKSYRMSVVLLVLCLAATGCEKESDLQTRTEQFTEHALAHTQPGYVCPMHPEVTSNDPGKCPICGMDLVQRKQEQMSPTSREPLYYRHPHDPQITSPVPAKDEMGMDFVAVYDDGRGSDVYIDPRVSHNFGLRTAKVEQGRLWKRIRSFGRVTYDETTMRHIHPRAEGWVEKLNVKSEGDVVSAGQVLFEIYAPALVTAQEEYLQAQRMGGESLVKASRQRLTALGVPPETVRRIEQSGEVDPRVQYRAEQSAAVVGLDIREGMYVTPATAVVSLADVDSIWIVAEVFESQQSWVAEGQEATITSAAFPEREWSGHVDFVYPEVDPQSRALPVRIRLDNSDGSLRPRSYVDVTIFGGQSEDLVFIPREALIRSGRNNRVIVRLSDNRYQTREVTPGIESGDYVAISAGLAPGETVVTSGQFLIDSEASLKSGLQRLSGPEETRP
jgi:Cu(I)/Ag(I) efflux system membrane fusion protein